MKRYKRQGFLLASVVVMYTILALIEQMVTYSGYTDIIDNNVEAVNTLTNVRSCLDTIDYTIMSSVYSEDQKSDEQLILQKLSECENYMEKYSRTNITPDERNTMDDFSEDFKNYKNKIIQISTAIGLGNIDTADQIYSNDVKDSARKKTNETLNKLTLLAESNKTNEMNKAAARETIICIIIIIISVMIIIVLLYFNKKQENAEKELADNNRTIEKQKGTINAAVFNDVLTASHNRMSFMNTFVKGKTEMEENTSYYFIMFDIDDFSAANVEYGTPSGDMILNSTASILKNNYDTQNVYRTGADEFVAVFKTESGAEGYKKFSETLEKTRIELAKPHKIKSGSLVVTYSISAVKKSAPGNVDSSVLGPLKGTLEQARIQQPGNVIYTDLDFGKV